MLTSESCGKIEINVENNEVILSIAKVATQYTYKVIIRCEGKSALTGNATCNVKFGNELHSVPSDPQRRTSDELCHCARRGHRSAATQTYLSVILSVLFMNKL